MMNTDVLRKQVLFHRNYNLDGKHNLEELPSESAVFGIFAIVNDEPANCRYVSETVNLRESIAMLFEKPEEQGMKEFMQGPWIQMIVYETCPNSTPEDRQELLKEWQQKYAPKISEDGEYPGYYNYQ